MTVSRQYWQNGLGHGIFNSIDWVVYQQIYHAQKQYNSIKKMLASMTPTKQRLHKLDEGVSPICPICNNNHETIHHVLVCPNNPDRLQNFREDIVQSINKYLKNQSSILHIIDNIITNNSTDDNIFLQQQNMVGWDQLIQAKFTVNLHEYIQPTLKSHQGGGKLGFTDYTKLAYVIIRQ
jgi:hypothetical protein